jgi:hypothetical protein
VAKLAWLSIALAGLGGPARADDGSGVYTLKLSPGVSRRQQLQTLPSGAVKATQNLGVGNEHAVVALLGDVAVVAYVSSNVDAATPGPAAIK